MIHSPDHLAKYNFRQRLSHRAIAANLTLWVILCGGCEVADPVDRAVPSYPNRTTEVTMHTVAGEDYSLPSWVTAEPFSGYMDHPELGGLDGGLGQKNWWISWADLEPVRGEYDWDVVDTALDNAAAGGYQLALRLLSIVYSGGDPDIGISVERTAPDWVFDEFDLTEDDLINLGWQFDINVIPAWRPDIRAAFDDLLQAFGERGYPQSEQIGSAYVHGISPSRGEEFWLQATNIDDMEQNSGFSPQVMREWLTSRMDVYAEAFGGVEHKLAWVGKLGAWAYFDGYDVVALDLLHHAWSLGMGNRSSMVELYNLWTTEPALGQSVDADGYLLVDETIDPIADGRYFGDENESYGDGWEWMFGDPAGDTQRYRLAMMRALQVRLRFLWTHAAAEQINPPLSEYARLGFGKTVANSPDAWAYLRESPVLTFVSPPGVLRNFERWLIQRDLPDGVTVATERVDRDFNAGGVPHGDLWAYYDCVARRTDLATGNSHIYFDLDDRFSVDGPVDIKVEIRDSSDSAWRIEYTNTASARVTTPPFQNQADGTVKTVTFTIYNARFINGLAHDMDFRIVCDGPQDLTVRWVRVVRHNL